MMVTINDMYEEERTLRIRIFTKLFPECLMFRATEPGVDVFIQRENTCIFIYLTTIQNTSVEIYGGRGAFAMLDAYATMSTEIHTDAGAKFG